MSKPFQFKQFQITQEKSAMKIGTDGVLLGAWANVVEAKTILDIGTGTGVIAIMCAQKNKNATITAIEIDDSAFEEATTNARQSPWTNRINVLHASLQEFQPSQPFDHIICNPPFFVESKLTTKLDPRSMARQEFSMPIDILAKSVNQLLSEKGLFSMIYPADRFTEVNEVFTSYDLHLTRQLIVYGRPGIEPKRHVLEWSRLPKQCETEDLIIEEFGRHQYSKKFKTLGKEFYLNF